MFHRFVATIILCCTLCRCIAQDSAEIIVPGRINAKEQLHKPYVILISADGFRYDYATKYNATNLLRLSKQGVRATSMIPSYPSVTFPNHYTIATGMYPSHHGIVYNRFYDRNRKQGYSVEDRKAVEDGTWWGGIPLWVLAEQQGMVTAAYGFVGSEAAVAGVYSTYWFKYRGSTPMQRDLATMRRWLHLPDSVRPHLIAFYNEAVDHAGHTYGPDSKHTRDAVLYVDRLVGELDKLARETKLPVNFIFVSDHGMTNVDTITRINPRTLIDTSKFIIKSGSTSMHLYAKDTSDILPAYQRLKQSADGFSVYLRDSIPKRFHYSTADDRFNRIGDFYILPHHPYVLVGGMERSIPVRM